MRYLLASSLVVLSCMIMSTAAAAEPLKPDMDKCKITFVGGKPTGETHKGGFKKFKIDAQADFENPSNSSIKLEIETESLFADHPNLEGHLKNADFFDVRKYPKVVFESTDIKPAESEATLVGKLTMLGKTEELTIPLNVEHVDNMVKLSGKFKLDRTKWGMTFGTEGNKINKEVEVAVELVFNH